MRGFLPVIRSRSNDERLLAILLAPERYTSGGGALAEFDLFLVRSDGFDKVAHCGVSHFVRTVQNPIGKLITTATKQVIVNIVRTQRLLGRKTHS